MGEPRASLRVDAGLWALFGQAVGARGRSADLKAYMVWRVANPGAALPGVLRSRRVGGLGAGGGDAGVGVGGE